MKQNRINRGITSESKGVKACHAVKSNKKAYDFSNKSGSVKTENKHFTIVKADDYKTKKAVYNSAHAHEWKRNANGQIDYLLTVKAMAEESDRIRYTKGESGTERAEYTKDGYTFYFCRLQWQNEKHGRLCTNPLSTKAGGRARQLETLKAHGVVNVPTMEEIRKACEA